MSKIELSNKEIEVITLLSQGLTNKDMADKLCRCEKTVKFHLTKIYKKLGVKSRSQAIAWYYGGQGLIKGNNC